MGSLERPVVTLEDDNDFVNPFNTIFGGSVYEWIFFATRKRKNMRRRRQEKKIVCFRIPLKSTYLWYKSPNDEVKVPCFRRKLVFLSSTSAVECTYSSLLTSTVILKNSPYYVVQYTLRILLVWNLAMRVPDAVPWHGIILYNIKRSETLFAFPAEGWNRESRATKTVFWLCKTKTLKKLTEASHFCLPKLQNSACTNLRVECTSRSTMDKNVSSPDIIFDESSQFLWDWFHVHFYTTWYNPDHVEGFLDIKTSVVSRCQDPIGGDWFSDMKKRT